MIQDIAPDRLDNAYAFHVPRTEDPVLLFDDKGKLYVRAQEGRLCFTTAKDIPDAGAVYLFAVNDTRYFLAPQTAECVLPGFEYKGIRELRELGQGSELFAAFTAYHLWKWYSDNRFCGKCGTRNGYHPLQRALQCPQCGQVIYPRINPAVIIGVIKDDCLLITRYRTGYAHNALVAGFSEIGETLEQTVQREVMEETGVRVRNIRYYKSQPWGMAQDLLMGFYCDAEGDGDIHMDENELRYAEWVRRDEIVLQPNDLSLTNDMMKQFKQNNTVAFG
ncbi:MAG: NAD(+) diphosphatase [Clostridia bacterium]|nr:NAD(+) diphosphatase [Clostridia bacterium]MBR5382504.1 NAD(+) diphosphatase [Clostridia bacterium]